ncbi:MAG: hypothetical protein KTR25_15275 [Myxococcales bacterium]|nr:hypothetical protein [Myxococcales bacterium]
MKIYRLLQTYLPPLRPAPNERELLPNRLHRPKGQHNSPINGLHAAIVPIATRTTVWYQAVLLGAIAVTGCVELKTDSCGDGSIDSRFEICQTDEGAILGNSPPGPEADLLQGKPIVGFNFDQEFSIPGEFSISGDSQISDDEAYSLPNSVRFTAPGNSYNRNYITLNISKTSLNERFFGRMMIFIVPAPQSQDSFGGDFTFVEAEGPPQTDLGKLTPPENMRVLYRYRVAANIRDNTLMANYDTWVDDNNDGKSDWPTNCYNHSEIEIPRGQWTCVQWFFEKATNQLRYWLEDEEIIDLRVQDSGERCLEDTQNGLWTAPETFERLHFGVEQYDVNALARTVYIDDIVIADKYIMCPQ